MEYLFLFLAIVILVFAFLLFAKIKSKIDKKISSKVDSKFKTQKGENGGIEFIRCPICNTPLKKTENLHSKIFRPMNTPDQRMMVQGCPHCFPKVEAGVKRICPVCHKAISLDDELVARLFNRTSNKKHVMILGCSVCMKMKKN